MLCNNCHQEISNKKECPYCGYDAVLDANGVTAHPVPAPIKLNPIRIKLLSKHNGKATAALILSLFTPAVIPGILAFIFALQGFFQAKNCRDGRGRSIFAMLILLAWISLFASIVWFVLYGNIAYLDDLYMYL